MSGRTAKDTASFRGCPSAAKNVEFEMNYGGYGLIARDGKAFAIGVAIDPDIAHGNDLQNGRVQFIRKMTPL